MHTKVKDQPVNAKYNIDITSSPLFDGQTKVIVTAGLWPRQNTGLSSSLSYCLS